jgi:hypothetical protein
VERLQAPWRADFFAVVSDQICIPGPLSGESLDFTKGRDVKRGDVEGSFSLFGRLGGQVMSLALVIIAVLGAGPDVAKLPVPNVVEQTRAERLINDVYGKKLKTAKTPDTKRTLAQELMEIGKKEPNAGNKYVCFCTAKSLAVEIHDGPLGLEVVQVLAAQFQTESGQDRDALIREAERLWEGAEKKRGTNQLASRLDAVELWLRSGGDSPIVAKNWEERINGLRSGGAIVLHAKDAKIVGTQMFYSPRIDCACNWNDPREYIEWSTSLPAGAYDARLRYASLGAGGGYLFAITASKGNAPQPIATATFVLRPTGGWEDIAESSVGRLALREDGMYTIRIRAIRQVQTGQPQGLLNIRTLVFDRR